MNTLLRQLDHSQQNGRDNYTAEEIALQPKSWKETWQKIYEEQELLTSFCETVFENERINVVLTGAGSSAFVGDVAADVWQRSFNRTAQAIPTTDLVTHFEDKITTQDPLLLISFSRSGNSPESTAAVKLANEKCDNVYHLIITCNPDGKLAAMKDRNTYVFLLPPDSEDQSLAMTNSFTSMLLAVVCIPKLLIDDAKQIEAMIETMASYAGSILSDFVEPLYKASTTNFNRIVFLGSGPNRGIAKESRLKVQELTNGKVIGKYNSFLGFRHGPKAVINDETLLVYLISNNPEVQPYEQDLVEQINKHDIGLTTLAVSETALNNVATNYAITLNNTSALDEELWAIVCALPAQIIGFFKSVLLNYNPDNPSPEGTIARVVEGVTIYPAAGQEI